MTNPYYSAETIEREFRNVPFSLLDMGLKTLKRGYVPFLQTTLEILHKLNK
jgi:hypothetical protein